MVMKYVVPSAVLLAGALGFGQSAEAGYYIVLDNYGDYGLPAWAQTSGTITIKTKINNVWATVCSYDPAILTEAYWCYINDGFDWDDVQGIRVQTNSSDGYWLDQIQLWSWEGPWDSTLRWTSGADNNTGWCFSNGAEDPSQYCLDGWWLARDWAL